jgi:isoleucyl-tRNA synthetase
MRWFLMDSPILRGGDLVVTERGIQEGVRQALLPLWNSYYFLALYANADGIEGRHRTDSRHLLDWYILAKTQELVTDVEAQFDVYDIVGACATVREFLDALTNWYVRRSRDRFWAGDRDAVDTLHTVLEITCRVTAPLLPLTTEVIWRGLTGGRSVHLSDWPLVDELPGDAALVEVMDRVREVCSTALGLRMANKLRVRLPLETLRVAAPDADRLREFADIIRDEVNVRRVELTEDVAAHGRTEIVVNARAAGPRLGKQVQDVIKAVKAGEWSLTPEGRVQAVGIELNEGEFERRIVSRDAGAAAELPRNSGFVLLDTNVTPELATEGMARDIVRAVQQARRDAGLAVSDRIRLTIDGREDAIAAARAHEALIAGETLALEVQYQAVSDGVACKVGDGSEVVVRVEKR